MRTYKLVVEYDGTNYNGFQRQTATTSPASTGAVDSKRCNDEEDDDAESRKQPPNKRQRRGNHKGLDGKGRKKGGQPCTIQEQIEDALIRLTGQTVADLRLRFAGRTDKGVHATGQIVAFDVHNDKKNESSMWGTSSTTTAVAEDVNLEPLGSRLEEKAITKLDNGQSQQLDGNTTSVGTVRENEPLHQKTEAGHYSPFFDEPYDHPDTNWKIRRAINTRLPPDISVRSVSLCPSPPKGGDVTVNHRPFEPRENVRLKRYTYRMRFRRKRFQHVANSCPTMRDSNNNDGTDVKSTIAKNYSDDLPLPICKSGPHTLRRVHDRNNIWICPWSLDERILSRVCNALVGKHDFTSFVHKHERRKKDNSIDLQTFHVKFLKEEDSDDDESYQEGGGEASVCNVKFTLEANGFRRSMVRNLVGFVVDVCRGQRTEDDIARVLEGTKEGGAAAALVNSAPACGLCLSKVLYQL